MKIWCISKYGTPEAYGPSTKLFNTAMSLSKHFDVTLISSNSNPKASYPISLNKINIESFNTLKHVWINLPNYKKSRSFKRFIGWLLFDHYLDSIVDSINEIPDVIIISSLPITTIRWALKMKKNHGSKVIFEVRDIYPLTMLEMGYSKHNPIIKYFAYLEKRGYEEADSIVGTMSQLSLHVENILDFKKETHYSPIGLSPLFLYKQDKLDLTLPSNKTIVGYTGSLGKANNLEPLIELMKLNKNNDKIHFLFVGDGEYLDELHKMCLPNLTLTGFIPPKDVYKALNSIDILLLSVHKSRVLDYGQSMNKFREYLAAGKPIIANYYGFIEEHLKTKGIFYVSHNDVESINNKLQELSSIDRNELKKIGLENSSIAAKHYDYETINFAYYNIINSMSFGNK